MTENDKSAAYLPKFPYHMVWIATNACNTRCLHCSSNSTVRSPDELTTQEVLDLFDQFADCGVIDLAISGGEPLLRSDIPEIVAHARKRGITVGVGSNGGRFSERQAEALHQSGLNRFQVSLDGFVAAHETLRQWNGLFDRVLKTIDIARKAGLRVHVCCTINRLNVEELEPFVEMVSKLAVQRINFSRYVPTGRGTDALDLTAKEWQKVVRLCIELRDQYKGRLEIVTHLAQEILVDDEIANMPAFIGCQAGIGQGAVTANGTVLPCVLLPIPLGNIRHQPFRQIWQDSPLNKTLRDRSNLETKCGSCQLRSRCGGCRAIAYAKTGNYLATDPRCWLEN